MLRHGRLARSARALRLAWARPSAHLAPRASLGRFKRSRASSGSVRQEACGAHAARAGIAARGRPHLTPRSARRSDTLTSLRAPRVARNARPHERSWRRAWGAGAPRWRAEAAALRGNLMAPERLARGARSPNGLHRSKGEQATWRARRLWRAHASPGAKVRKCHDGAWTPSRKRHISHVLT